MSAVTCRLCGDPLDVPENAHKAKERLCIGCYRKCLRSCQECTTAVQGRWQLKHKYQTHLCLGNDKFPCHRCGGTTPNLRVQLECPHCKNERNLLVIPEVGK